MTEGFLGNGLQNNIKLNFYLFIRRLKAKIKGLITLMSVFLLFGGQKSKELPAIPLSKFGNASSK